MLTRLVRKFLFLFIIICCLTGCATSGRQDNDTTYKNQDKKSEPVERPYVPTPDGNLWDDMAGDLQLPVDVDSRSVQTQIRWYQAHQQFLNRTIERASPYIYYIYSVTHERKLPAELALIPVIESAYNPFLYSRTGATGLWQMMPGTASGFGLKINWWYDGRRDVVASTKAALKYITYLHYYFNNDWLLAVAAYDAGEGSVQSAVLHNQRNNLDTDFWSLPLPNETKLYIPRLLALAAIIKNPGRYGVYLRPVNGAPCFEPVDVGSQIDLAQAAKLAGVEVATIRNLNPGFRRWASDPDGPYTLLLPKGRAETFKEKLAALPEDDRTSWQEHVVARGETLQGIAHKYHVDLGLLRKINELPSNKVKPSQELLIPKSAHKEENELVEGVQHATIAEEKLPGPKQIVHTVKPGETVNSVAKKYGVKPNQVAYWNQIGKDEDVDTDDELVIWRSGKGPVVAKHAVSVVRYTVTSGDSVASIAKKFNVASAKLMRLNHLKTNVLQVGQIVKVPGVRHSQLKKSR